jgi:hypothetical protein
MKMLDLNTANCWARPTDVPVLLAKFAVNIENLIEEHRAHIFCGF